MNWKIGEVEIESIRRLALILTKQFEQMGLPEPKLASWIEHNDISKASFMDMAHPSCTTRMGTDSSTSVVNENAMVHGIDGLFVAGSSVFPTPGHANPTLMLLALAVRLGDHLRDRHSKVISNRKKTGVELLNTKSDAERALSCVMD